MMIVETNDVKLLGQLIELCNRLLRIHERNESADNAEIEHIVLRPIVFGEK